MLSTIKKILNLLQTGDKLKLFILFLMMLFRALLEVIGIGMIPAFVSIIAAPDIVLNMERLIPLWSRLGIETSGDLLVYGAILLIGVFIVKNLYFLFYNYTQSRFIWMRFASIGSNLFRHYMNAPYEFILRRNSAELLRNVTQETKYLARNVLTPIILIAKDVVLTIGIFTLLLLIEPVNTILVFLILGGGGALFLRIIRERIRKYGRKAQSERENMIRAVNEGLGGFKDARVLNREKWFIKRFASRIKNYGRLQIFGEAASMANKPIIETIAVSGLLLITLILYWQGRPVESVIPTLALFGAATVRLMPTIQEIMKSFTNLRYYVFSIEPIYNDTHSLQKEGMNYLEKISGYTGNGSPGESKKLDFHKNISFEEISYSYPKSDKAAVKNLSLSIPRGHAVGFVGPSGAGKTTLVDILLGLLEPQRGRITIDGVNIHTNIAAWKDNIGYIPQFIFLADDTIKNNVAFGLPENDIDEAKLQNAIEAAQLDDFIKTLPDGVNTVIGERGTRLSGGQRQRIGIARALYNNPRVLVMDEATSALDNVTESYVINAMERLKGERTIIMIAHRLTTVKKCDHLYFMQEGQITDSGSYEELIGKNSEFKKMALAID
jgi:ATP-binding cassette, subfamily B, bacterial PglK